MRTIEEKICTFISKTNMINPYDSILVGLSGGADSVCLLHVLVSLREKYGLQIYAVHVNHMIRGAAADADEKFSEELCKKLDIPYKCYKEDVPKLASKWHMTLEEAARKVRYEIYYTEGKRVSANKKAVAHHMNDQAETVLFRMCRGTGIKGMRGIAAQRDDIIRPLLCVTRDEILEYLTDIGAQYVNDETNDSICYDRNRIRHKVIPELMCINDGAVQHIADTAAKLEDIYDWLNETVSGYIKENVRVNGEKNRVTIDSTFLNGCHKAVSKELVRRMINMLTDSLKDITTEHINNVLLLTALETGKSVDLPYELIAHREYDVIVIEKRLRASYDEIQSQEIVHNKQYVYHDIYLPDEGQLCECVRISSDIMPYDLLNGDIPKNYCTKWFDYDKIKGKIEVRKVEDSDYYRIGNEGKKKLSRYMIDKKIPRNCRDRLLVVAVGNEVLWIVGGHMSGSAYISETTKKVLVMAFK